MTVFGGELDSLGHLGLGKSTALLLLVWLVSKGFNMLCGVHFTDWFSYVLRNMKHFKADSNTLVYLGDGIFALIQAGALSDVMSFE